MKKKLSLFLAAFIAATVFTVRAAVQANDPVTLTWDFSEEQFNWTTPDTLQIPDEGLDYRGMLLKMKFTPNAGIKDFVSKIGFRPNGTSTTDNRYIQYIPEYDGKLTVYYASNNATATDRITAVGTAIKTFKISDAVPTEVIAYGVTEGSTVKSFTADLTKGTTYYIYLANGGQRISKLEFTYTPTPDPQPAEGETTTTTFDFTSSEFISGLGLTVPAAGKTTYIEEAVTYDKVTLTPIKCSSNWPGIYNSNGELSFRIYKLANGIKGGAQFSVSNGTVDKIVITGNTQLANVTSSNGTIEMSSDNKTLTWTKAAGESPASVVFYHEGSSTLTISTIDVTKTIVGGDIPETTYGIVGDLTGGWEVDAEMKKAVGADGVYTLVVKDFEAKAGTKYEYKLRANKSWDGYQLPAGQENFTWTPDADGIYTLTFTANINENTLDLVATKTSINTVAELNKLENNAAFKFFGNAIVVAKMTKNSSNYVYVTDETGSSLIYDQTGEFTGNIGIGNVLTAPWAGTVSIYKNLFEAKPTEVLGSTSTVEVKYPVATADDVKAENMNQVVELKGLTIASVSGNNINFTIGNAAVPGYNQFGIELPAETEGKTFDVVGAISVYNQNVQFQPITITEGQEPQPVTTRQIYLKPGIWTVDNARFAVNVLSREDPTINEWYNFVLSNDEGYYMAEIPDAAPMIRLYRFDPATTENSANPGAFWNRTDVIVLNANTNLYKITAWPEAEGGNCAYEAATYPETLYTVNIAEGIENGSVAVDPEKAAAGDKVTVSTKPAENFELASITVTGVNTNQAVQVADDGTFVMIADDVTVSATFKEKAAPQPTVEKLYIIGNGTENEWNNTTEVTFNEQTSAFEYEITAKADCYIAFGDAELNNDWDTFNGSHRYSLVAGKNVVPTIGKALQLILTQGEGCVLLAPGYKYALSVTKDLKLTVTREELPAQKFTASFSNTGNWADVWAYTFSKDAEGQQTEELGEWPGTKLKAGEDGIFNVEIETSVAPQYIVFNNGVQGDGMIKTENLKFENGNSYEYIQTQTFSVSFKTGKNWDKVYAYTFNPELSGEWPGTEITSTLAEGVYTYAFEAAKAPEFIIFNNGNGGEGNQTADLEFEDGKAYEYGVEPTPEEKEFTVQFVNNRGWQQGSVHAYVYGEAGEQLGVWPGTEMGLIDTEVTYGGVNYPVYELKFKATAAPEFIIFNNGQGGNDNQSEDLVFINEKQYLVLPMKGELACSVKEPMQLDYSDKVKIYNGMPMIIWGQPMLDSKVTFKVGDALHIRIVNCPDMRSPGLQLMSNDGKTPITENLAKNLEEVPAIITIPITGAVYEWMKDADHRVRLNGQNVFIDRMTVEPDVYPAAETPAEEETTISVWVPENAEGEQIVQDAKVEIPATPFIVVDVKKEEIVKIKASNAVAPSRALGGAVTALDASDISILKKGTETLLIEDEKIRVSEDGSGYEFTVTEDLATTLKTEGFDIKNKTEKPLVIKAIEVQQVIVPEDIEISPESGDIAAALAAASEGKVVGNITINLTGNAVYSISAPIVAPASVTINGADGAVIDASALEGNFIQMAATYDQTDQTATPTEWTVADIAVKNVTIKGLKKALFYSTQKMYVANDFTIDNCTIEQAADATTIDYTKGSTAKNITVTNSTFYAPTATTKSFYSSQGGQKYTEYDAATEAMQTFKFHNNTMYNLAPAKNFFSHRQNSQKWLTYDVKNNIFVNCGKSGQVIKGMNGGGSSANPVWDIDGNIYNYDGADTSAAESTGDEAEPVKNSIAGVVTFTDAANGDFNGTFLLAPGTTAPATMPGDPQWILTTAASYTITISTEISNGTVVADKAVAAEGDEVTLTITPAEGYELESISVTGVTTDVAVIVTEGKFTMPADAVTVNATFKMATGINNIDNDGVAGEKDVYYNLQGVRVENPGKGLYIKNGKKVLVK